MPNNYTITSNDASMHDIGDNLETGALVASGDCFVTLATQLDELAHDQVAPEDLRSKLEAITKTLIDLQRQYKIVKK